MEYNKEEDVETIYFYLAGQAHGSFSHFYHSPIVYNNLSFSTGEQFMMYQKARMFNDKQSSDKILLSPDLPPYKHKVMGRNVEGFSNEVWHTKSFNIIVGVNLCKFTQNKELLDQLMNTGSALLVEASPTDRVWGVGFTVSCAHMYKKLWGENKLGKVLMTVRDKLRVPYELGKVPQVNSDSALLELGISEVLT